METAPLPQSAPSATPSGPHEEEVIPRVGDADATGIGDHPSGASEAVNAKQGVAQVHIDPHGGKSATATEMTQPRGEVSEAHPVDETASVSDDASAAESKEQSQPLIHMRGLPFSVTEDQIRTFFKDFELAEEAPITFFSRGVVRGIGFVKLKNPNDISAAIVKLNLTHIGYRFIELSKSTEEDLLAAIDENKEAERAAKYFVLRLRGLPFSTTKEQLEEFLTPVSKIAGIQLCKDGDGRNTGDAFVEVETEGQVEEVRALHMSPLGTRYVEVMLSTPQDRDSIVLAASRRRRGWQQQQQQSAGAHSNPYHSHDVGRGQRGMPYAPGGQMNNEYGGGGNFQSRGQPHHGAAGGVRPDDGANASPIVNPFMGAMPGPHNMMLNPLMMMMMNSQAAGMGFFPGGHAPAFGGVPSFIVRLRGLLPTAGEEEIRNFLAPAGNLGRVDICRDGTGRSIGEAFVDALTKGQLEKLRSMHRTRMGTRPIDILASSAEERMMALMAAPMAVRAGAGMPPYLNTPVGGMDPISAMQMYFNPYYDGQGMGPNDASRGGRAHERNAMNPFPSSSGPQPQAPPFNFMSPQLMSLMMNPPSNSFHQPQGVVPPGAYPQGFPAVPTAPTGYPAMPPTREPSELIVRVRGLPYSATEEDIAEFFSNVSIPPQGVHMVYNEHNRPTGEAFVELLSFEDVQSALSRSGGAMSTRYIEVFVSSLRDMQRLYSPSGPIGRGTMGYLGGSAAAKPRGGIAPSGIRSGN